MTEQSQPVQFTPEEIETGMFIKMPAQALADWLDDLRSGNFKQGSGVLFNFYNNTYCCLGLQQRHKDRHGVIEEGGLPSLEYLEHNGIRFRDTELSHTRDPVIKMANGNYIRATSANDSGASFTEIADAIEKVAVGY